MRCDDERSVTDVDGWDDSNLEAWLQDHKSAHSWCGKRLTVAVPNPQHLSTEQLRSLVEQNYDSASNALTDNDIANWFKSNSLVPSPTSKSRSRALDTIRRSYGGKATSYTSWDSADLSGWLEARSIAVAGKLTTQDHGLKPKPKSTREELLDQVQANWESARTYVADAGRAAQTPFANAANAVSDTWTESQLREYRTCDLRLALG